MSQADDVDLPMSDGQNDSAPLIQEIDPPSSSIHQKSSNLHNVNMLNNNVGVGEHAELEEEMKNFENQNFLSDPNSQHEYQQEFTGGEPLTSEKEQETVKPIEQAGNTTEFLMLTLSKALKIDSKELQDLISNRSEFLIDSCAKGMDGDFQPIIEWLDSMKTHSQLMLKLFRIAYAKQKAVEVLLVLTSLRCGFFSENEEVCRRANDVLIIIADALFKMSYEYGVTVKKEKNVNKIVQVKIPIFRQFQDWFIQPKSFTNQTPLNLVQKKRQKGAKQNEDMMNGMLRIVSETTLENHPSMALEIGRLLLAVFRETSDPDLPPSADIVFLPEKLSEVFADDIYLCYSLLAQVLPVMRQIDKTAERNCVYQSKLIAMLLFRANEAEEDLAVRLQALSLLLDLWSTESSAIINLPPQTGKKETAKESFYSVIKAGLNHQDRVFKIAIFGQAFHVLDCLIEQRSAESPVFLRLLVQAMFNTMEQRKKDRITEEFCLRNFSILFQNNQDIPVSVIVDPLNKIFAERLKGYRKQGGTQHVAGHLSSEELSFLIKIAQHSKLTQQSAFSIFEILTTLYVSRPPIALLLIDSIIHIVDKFQVNPKIIQFLDTILIAKALSMILTLKKDEQLKLSKSPYVQQAIMVNEVGGSTKAGQGMSPELKGQIHRVQNEINLKMQRYQMVHLIERLLQLNIDKIEPMVTEQIKPLSDRYVAIFKQPSSAYEYIINRYNLPVQKPLLALSYQPENQVQLVESNSDSMLLKDSEPISTLERRLRTIEKEKFIKNQKKREKLLQDIKEPKSELALKAIEQVNQIRNKRIQNENQKRLEEVKKKEKLDKMQGEASQDVQMSRLILERELQERKQKVREMLIERESPQKGQFSATPVKAAALQMQDLNPFYQHLLNNPIAANQINKSLREEEMRLLRNYFKTGLLVNFEYEEEERERDSMRLLVLKNRNTFQYLFKKYSQFGNLNKRKGSIEIGQSERTISNGEIQKFLKDNQIEIGQKELFALIKIINDAMFLRHGTLMLEFAGFVQLIIQMSIYLTRRGKFGLFHKGLMFYDMTLAFLKHLQEQAKRKNEVPLVVLDIGESEEPETKGAKVKNASPIAWYEQRVPGAAKMAIGEAKVIALEILDNVFYENIGISLFESTFKQGEKAQKLQKPKHLPFDQEAERELKSFQQTLKAKPNGKQKQVAQEQPQPKGLEVYSVKNVIRVLDLLPAHRNQKKDKEAEKVLMGMHLTPTVKLTCFELQQVNPQSMTADLQEISLTLDEMVQSLHDQRQYKSTIAPLRHIRKFSLPKLQDNVEKREKYIDYSKQKEQEELSQKRKRDEEYHSRGLKLKEQVEINRKIKEKRDIQRQQQELEEREQELKKQLIKQQAYLRQKQQMALERDQKNQEKQMVQVQEALKSQTDEMLKHSNLQLRKVATSAAEALRHKFINETEFSDKQRQLANEKETFAMLEQLYTKNKIKLFDEYEDMLFDSFRKILLFQNNISRGQGMPGHKGINLDGILSFLFYAQVVPQFLTLEDIAYVIKKHLENRQYYPSNVGASTEALETGELQIIQQVNFNKYGGTLNFEEFKMLLMRIVGHFEQETTGRNTAMSKESNSTKGGRAITPATVLDQESTESRQGSPNSKLPPNLKISSDNVNDVLAEKILLAQDLHIEAQVKGKAREIKLNWDAVKRFNEILKDQDSLRQQKGLLKYNEKLAIQKIEEFLSMACSLLSQQNSMNLPITPLTNTVVVRQFSSQEMRKDTSRSYLEKSRRNVSTTEQQPKTRIRSQLKNMPTQLRMRAGSQFQSNRSTKDASDKQSHKFLLPHGTDYDTLQNI